MNNHQLQNIFEGDLLSRIKHDLDLLHLVYQINKQDTIILYLKEIPIKIFIPKEYQIRVFIDSTSTCHTCSYFYSYHTFYQYLHHIVNFPQTIFTDPF